MAWFDHEQGTSGSLDFISGHSLASLDVIAGDTVRAQPLGGLPVDRGGGEPGSMESSFDFIPAVHRANLVVLPGLQVAQDGLSVDVQFVEGPPTDDEASSLEGSFDFVPGRSRRTNVVIFSEAFGAQSPPGRHASRADDEPNSRGSSIDFIPAHRRANAGTFSSPSFRSALGLPAWTPGLRPPSLDEDQSLTWDDLQSRLLAVYAEDARRYVLRPSRLVRTMSGGLSTPGGTKELCAEWEPMAQLPVPVHEVCAICLETLKSGDLVQPMVQCWHLFHQRCIRELIQVRQSDPRRSAERLQPLGDRISCPLCRGQVAAADLAEVPELERSAVVPLAIFVGEGAPK